MRVGPFKDVMTWSEYVAFLWTGWAPRRHWECSFKRVPRRRGLVLLELEERSEPNNPAAAADSFSASSSTAQVCLRHLDVYLQMPPAPS